MSDLPIINLPINSGQTGTLLKARGVRAASKYPNPKVGQPGFDGKCFALVLEGEWGNSGPGTIFIKSSNAAKFAVKDGILAPPQTGEIGDYTVTWPHVRVEFIEKDGVGKVYNIKREGAPGGSPAATGLVAAAAKEAQARGGYVPASVAAPDLVGRWQEMRRTYGYARDMMITLLGVEHPDLVAATATLFIEANKRNLIAPPPDPLSPGTGGSLDGLDEAPETDTDSDLPF